MFTLRTLIKLSCAPLARLLLALAAALLGTGLAHAAGPTGLLNDTGIADCWNDSGISNGTGIESDTGTHPRQDCRYGRDPAAMAGMPKTGAGGKGFDFTKITNNGSALPALAALGSGPTDRACMRDNV